MTFKILIIIAWKYLYFKAKIFCASIYLFLQMNEKYLTKVDDSLGTFNLMFIEVFFEYY